MFAADAQLGCPQSSPHVREVGWTGQQVMAQQRQVWTACRASDASPTRQTMGAVMLSLFLLGWCRGGATDTVVNI